MKKAGLSRWRSHWRLDDVRDLPRGLSEAQARFYRSKSRFVAGVLRNGQFGG